MNQFGRSFAKAFGTKFTVSRAPKNAFQSFGATWLSVR
jgi:hypothetical protein